MPETRAAALLRIAGLRSKIAVLARGGECGAAVGLLVEHVGVDLRVDLRADAIRRAHQACAVAERDGDAHLAARAHTALALALLGAGEPGPAAQAAELAVTRATALNGFEARRLQVGAWLVTGMAGASQGDLAGARTALARARSLAAPMTWPDLFAAILATLGNVELMDGDVEAAAVCFWFARDFFRLAADAAGAARAEAMPLVGFAAARRWDDVVALAPAIAADAEAHGQLDTAARVRGLYADARIATGAADAQSCARVAAAAAASLPEGSARSELVVMARLRLARLGLDPAERELHLEAAADVARSDRAVGPLAALAIGIVEGLADAQFDPAAGAILRGVAGDLRRLGAQELADLAVAAAAELHSAS